MPCAGISRNFPKSSRRSIETLMPNTLRFLIIDGYPKASRDEFDAVGMKHAWRLYAEMLKTYLPEAEYSVWLPSDNPTPPDGLGPEHYQGILWTGCNLTIYHLDNPCVTRQIEYAKQSYRSEEHTSELQSLRHLVC